MDFNEKYSLNTDQWSATTSHNLFYHPIRLTVEANIITSAAYILRFMYSLIGQNHVVDGWLILIFYKNMRYVMYVQYYDFSSNEFVSNVWVQHFSNITHYLGSKFIWFFFYIQHWWSKNIHRTSVMREKRVKNPSNKQVGSCQ